MKIFIDTNIVLRFFVKEDERTYNEVVNLLAVCQQGKIRPYTSNIVIQEIVYVLHKLYSFPKKQVLDAINDFMQLRNLTVIEKTDTKKALSLYKQNTIKFGDCLIATQIPEGVTLCTYDQEFPKKLHISVVSPEEVLSRL